LLALLQLLTSTQMPIVDGLTSTKMIRSFEKSHPTHVLSKRAALNGRIPVIAVSASLIEKDRQSYIDDGFDGWILKPISFDRLKHIMLGIVDPGARKENIYKTGGWERGGWFGKSKKDIFAADTKPNEQPPMTAPSEGVKNAASSDDPFVREEDNSVQTQEQKRMADAQEEEKEKSNDEPDGGEDTPKISAVADTTDEQPQAPAEDEKVEAEAEAEEQAAAEPPATEPAES
jgi:CheY-like chemotaxis protein